MLLPAGQGRVWQARAAQVLAAFPGIEVQVCHVDVDSAGEDRDWTECARAMPELREIPMPPADEVPRGMHWNVVVDLAGVESSEVEAWKARGRHGLWQPRDAQGRHLADAFACHASICSGSGGELFLVRNGVDVLNTVRFHASPDYRRSLTRLYAQTEWLIKGALRPLLLGGGRAIATKFSPRPAPSRLRRKLQGRAGAVRARLRRIAAKCLSENWMIGVIEAPIHSLLSSSSQPKVKWLGKRASTHYHADPFGIPGQTNKLYCETFDYHNGDGRIELLELDGRDAIEAIAPASLPLSGHLSYPYLFNHEGRLYGIPETAKQRHCKLYEIDGNGHWHFVTTLLEDVAAADATLFFWDGLFWLAYTDIALGEFDNLCLSWSRNLTGPWQPHAGNPVKIDHRNSRSAGTPFVHDGVLYRPAQDCRSAYGQATVINRVVQCTPYQYLEEPVRRLCPDPFGANPHGLHTLSAWGSRTLVDGKRYVMNLHELRRKINRRLRGRGRADEGLVPKLAGKDTTTNERAGPLWKNVP